MIDVNKRNQDDFKGCYQMAKEKIIIIAVKLPMEQDDRFHSSLAELESLGTTAGGEVIKTITQNRTRIHPALYIGEGKIQEMKQVVDEEEIDLVISNDELSAGQLRNLGNRLDVRVIDRSQLILDIFAQRARTKEGKLQVELAQLEYVLPRLRGKGTELSRLGAGIGTRGPGETKLETDQRHIRNRIYDIRRRLKTIVQQREQYRKRRKTNDVFQIAIVGYTNAGKSTLFNQLTNSESLAENQLFATLDPLTRNIQLPSGFQTLITDTVGFLQKLPTTLIAAFRSTLEEVAEADFILHVVDSSHIDATQHQETVIKLLQDLDADQIPMLTVYNKKDLLTADFIPMQHPYAMLNATDAADVQQLLQTLETVLIEDWDRYIVHVNPDEGKLLTQFKQQTITTERKYDESDNVYTVKGFMRTDHPLRHVLERD